MQSRDTQRLIQAPQVCLLSVQCELEQLVGDWLYASGMNTRDHFITLFMMFFADSPEVSN